MKNRIFGTAGDDTLRGTDAADEFYGRRGDDLLVGRGGDDSLTGEDGSDTLIGGAGNDVLRSGTTDFSDRAMNSLNGGAGDDVLAGSDTDTEIGGGGNDTLGGGTGGGGVYDGGAGRDLLDLGINDSSPYTGDLAALADARTEVEFDGAILRGIEGGAVYLPQGDNVVALASGLHGWAVNASGGNDRLTGNAHADTLSGGDGDNTLVGGGGDDVLRASSPFHDNDRTVFDGGAGDDVITGPGKLQGGDGDDSLTGDLFSRDVLKGGAGVDTLYASAGGDVLEGGGGRDLYVFPYPGAAAVSAPTLIDDRDFGVVDLSEIDAKYGNKSHEDAFKLVDAFTGHAGELTIAYSTADRMTHVEGDTNGDAQADLVILITGDHTDPSQFVL